MNVFGSFICNSPKLKSTPCPSRSEWISKLSVIYLYNGACLTDEKSLQDITWIIKMITLNESNQTKKYMPNSCIFKAIQILPLKQRSCPRLPCFRGLGISFLAFPILRNQ